MLTNLDTPTKSSYVSVVENIKEYRDEKKALVTYNRTSCFISFEMYSGTPKAFFYGMVYQLVTIREFRKHNSYPAEINKVFVSGVTKEEVLNKLKILTDFSIFN